MTIQARVERMRAKVKPPPDPDKGESCGCAAVVLPDNGRDPLAPRQINCHRCGRPVLRIVPPEELEGEG